MWRKLVTLKEDEEEPGWGSNLKVEDEDKGYSTVIITTVIVIGILR